MTPKSPELKTAPTPRERGVAQVRTIARRANMDVNQLLVKLREAGVKALDNGPLYAISKVDLDSAMRALQVVAENQAAETPMVDRLKADAEAAAGKTLEPTAQRYTGDEDQQQPQFIVEGAFNEDYMDFPPIPNPDPDKIYRPIHINPDRQNRMVMKGYQFVVNKEHIRRIGLGTLEKHVNGRNRVQYKDRELAFISVTLAMKIRQKRKDAMIRDRAAIEESFEANVEAQRRKLGAGGDKKLAPITMSEGEAVERKEHAEAAKAGVTRVVVDYGATSKA